MNYEREIFLELLKQNRLKEIELEISLGLISLNEAGKKFIEYKKRWYNEEAQK